MKRKILDFPKTLKGNTLRVMDPKADHFEGNPINELFEYESSIVLDPKKL
jgi:hypothetical protein